MKWLMIKMLVMTGLMIGILNYVAMIQTGKSPLANIDWSLPDFSLPELSVPDIDMPDIGGDSGTTRVYKWVGADGVVNYTATPPPNGEAEAMDVDPNTNLVQGTPVAKAPEASGPVNSADDIPKPTILPTPSRVKKLIEDANNVQNLMDDRAGKLDNL